MKKQLIIAALALGLSSGAFAQGYVNVSATGSPVKQDFLTGTSASASGNVRIAVLWGSGNSLIGNTASSTASFTTNAPTVWTSLLNDPNYRLANNSGSLITALTTTGLGAGNFSAGDVPIDNSTAGASLTLIVIGWNSAYATPQLAAAANAAVGWSAPVTYASGASSIATVLNMTQSGLAAFGVDTLAPVVVPEPTTLALAGLSGASLLLFRRKK